MNKTALSTVIRNLALLALVVLPLFFVLVWAQALFARAADATNLGYVLETGSVYYLTNVVPVLLGGLIHQVIWLLLPNAWPGRRRRMVALLLAPVIPMAVLVSWGGPAGSLLSFAVPMALALAVHVLLMRGPASSQAVTA